jgi:hypothetical protein
MSLIITQLSSLGIFHLPRWESLPPIGIYGTEWGAILKLSLVLTVCGSLFCSMSNQHQVQVFAVTTCATRVCSSIWLITQKLSFVSDNHSLSAAPVCQNDNNLTPPSLVLALTPPLPWNKITCIHLCQHTQQWRNKTRMNLLVQVCRIY